MSPRDLERIRFLRLILTLLGLFTVAPLGSAQRNKVPANDPSECPYCEGDPKRMEKAGIVSHGGFEFGKTDTAETDARYPGRPVYWIESEHFEIGFGIDDSYKVDREEKDRVVAELKELNKVLPRVSTTKLILDPWLRAHLFALRFEKIYARFEELLGLEDAEWPSGLRPWNMVGKYMGEGPYLGQKGKYEVLVLAKVGDYEEYTAQHFGQRTTHSLRWNVPDRGTLTVTTHAEQGHGRKDLYLHSHLAYQITHNLVNGYKHYSYETPVWLRIGLAHVIEREISPDYNTFDVGEGADVESATRSRWHEYVKKLVRQGSVPYMAEMVRLAGFNSLDSVHHYVSWSMVTYLIQEHPEGFAKLNDAIHGLKDEKGYSDASRLKDVQRESFKEFFGMSYTQFDEAWREWVVKTRLNL